MATLNQLSTATTLTSSDQIIFYSTVNGSGRKASLNTLLEYIEANFASPDFVKQYATPNVNGTNVQVASTTQSTWLIVTPTGPFAAMTITPPAAAQLADGTELLVVCSQSVSALTIATNGAASIVGAPSALSANSSFMLRFDGVSKNWYAVQSTLNAAVSTQGTFTPAATLAVPATGTTFGVRYTTVNNVVTLEFSVNLSNPGSFSFTTATDYFTGLPAAIQPTSLRQFVSSPPVDGWQLALGYDGGSGTWRMIFTKSGSPSLLIAAPPNPAGSYRWTITYLV